MEKDERRVDVRKKHTQRDYTLGFKLGVSNAGRKGRYDL
jgi:hypothetical protein